MTVFQDVHVVVLAAGKGTRLKSSVAKVLHRAAGKPLIELVLSATRPLKPSTIAVVVGHQTENVKSALADSLPIKFAVQEPQLGTGHALLQSEPLLRGE